MDISFTKLISFINFYHNFEMISYKFGKNYIFLPFLLEFRFEKKYLNYVNYII